MSAWGGANPGSAEACIVCGTAAGEVAEQPKRKKQGLKLKQKIKLDLQLKLKPKQKKRLG